MHRIAVRTFSSCLYFTTFFYYKRCRSNFFSCERSANNNYTDVVSILLRAGFTLSRVLFGKNVVARHLGRQALFFLEKTGDLFFFFSHRLSSVAHYIRHAKICRSSCEAPFCGAPVRSNMLNMPKSGPVFSQLKLRQQQPQLPR